MAEGFDWKRWNGVGFGRVGPLNTLNTRKESLNAAKADGARVCGEVGARSCGVPRTGTGEFAVPCAGIVRPFCFSCGKFEFVLADPNCAQFTLPKE